ncbi:MAG TPA: hypothetical protein VGX71_12490 [Pseudaminobacter sp.]|nr:hypothetical protein [Pseudaminobacter sp.]
MPNFIASPRSRIPADAKSAVHEFRSRGPLALIHVKQARFCYGQHRARCNQKVTIEGGNTARAAPLMEKSGVPGRAGLKAIPGDVMKRAHWEN